MSSQKVDGATVAPRLVDMVHKAGGGCRGGRWDYVAPRLVGMVCKAGGGCRGGSIVVSFLRCRTREGQRQGRRFWAKPEERFISNGTQAAKGVDNKGN